MDQIDSVFAKARADIEAERQRVQLSLQDQRVDLQNEFAQKEAALRDDMSAELKKRHGEWQWITRASGATNEELPSKRPKVGTHTAGGSEILTGADEVPEILELNVGGKVFVTTRSTLTRVPDSMLAAMFSGRHPVCRGPDGRFFIDNDGSGFHVVLDYLRHGKLIVEDAELHFLKRRLRCDAEFYCLPELAKELQEHDEAAKSDVRGKIQMIAESAPYFTGALQRLLTDNPKSRVLGYERTASHHDFTCLVEVL